MESLSQTTAIILAGGFGTRLRSVVGDRPKILAEIGGRPFVTYLLDQLETAGLTHVVLSTGYLGDYVHATLGETYGPLQLDYSCEPAPLGTGGAIRLALPLIKSDTTVIMNGDSFCDVNFKDLWRWHHERAANATIVVTTVPDAERYGQVCLDTRGRVEGFREKGKAGGPGCINAGVYLMATHLPQAIPQGQNLSLEHQVFPAEIGRDLYGFQTDGRFIDIGTPESYEAAKTFFSMETAK